MEEFRYLPGVATLELDEKACVGCGVCEIVCPHGVFLLDNSKARINDLDGCMECGACTKNCSANAIRVSPGVGCAAYIIQTWVKGKAAASGDGETCC